MTLGTGPESVQSNGQNNGYGAASISISDPTQSHNQQTLSQGQQSSYLSLASGLENQNGASNNNSNENKTIVLAIPAKINFLSDNRSASLGYAKQQQPTIQTSSHPSSNQQQQLTLIQPSGDQYTYTSAKQLGK